MASQKKILLIEDDSFVVEAVKLALMDQEFNVDVEENGQRGLDAALSSKYDAVITDINLPELSGFDICRKLREDDPLLPILVLTSCTDEIDIVLGLEQGADDYLVKPFKARELCSRVRALLRRGAAQNVLPPQEMKKISIEGFEIDLSARRAFVDGEKIALTSIEFELLAYLLQAAGRSVGREELVEAVMSYSAGDYDATLNSHISRIRSKLGRYGEFLETLRGFGYRFNLELQ